MLVFTVHEYHNNIQTFIASILQFLLCVCIVQGCDQNKQTNKIDWWLLFWPSFFRLLYSYSFRLNSFVSRLFGFHFSDDFKIFLIHSSLCIYVHRNEYATLHYTYRKVVSKVFKIPIILHLYFIFIYFWVAKYVLMLFMPWIFKKLLNIVSYIMYIRMRVYLYNINILDLAYNKCGYVCVCIIMSCWFLYCFYYDNINIIVLAFWQLM